MVTSLTEQEIEQIIQYEEANERQELQSERKQRPDNESKSKTVWKAAISSMFDSKNKKACGTQIREEAGDVLVTLVGYLNRDIKKINRLSSAVSAQKYIQDKHLGNRFNVREQDLDDNTATPNNTVTSACGSVHPQAIHFNAQTKWFKTSKNCFFSSQFRSNVILLHDTIEVESSNQYSK
ncbi:MAG: hypothetical protein EZS28_009652 [Streblomastix strix]|uniref:Uncharacterized protein n=1 Tax=Streblomastix strix TaxID=222440 RepID=A0A5J4WKJ5_9EUKA|nr:MAG: hypothetical protein EZS28_009652 [Streblomastix strix]